MSDTFGLLHSDNSVGMGIPFVTHDVNGDEQFLFANLQNVGSCVVLANGSLQLENACPMSLTPICKSRLGKK